MIQQKRSFVYITLFLFIGVVSILPAQADNRKSDWKSLPGNACKSSGDDPGELVSFASGWAAARSHVTVTCPIIKDIRRSKKIKFRVNILHTGTSASDLPETNIFKKLRTRCFLAVNNQKGDESRHHLLDINGQGFVHASRKIRMSSRTGSIALYCHIAKNNVITSYSYIEK